MSRGLTDRVGLVCLSAVGLSLAKPYNPRSDRYIVPEWHRGNK